MDGELRGGRKWEKREEDKTGNNRIEQQISDTAQHIIPKRKNEGEWVMDREEESERGRRRVGDGQRGRE